MTSQLLKKLTAAGNDMTEYLTRFEQDEETCELLLSMFASETDYKDYLLAYETNDLTACTDHMKLLKASAHNVGLTRIRDKAYEILGHLRDGNSMGLKRATGELSDIYSETLEILRSDEIE